VANERIRKFVNAELLEAVSPEHERLKGDLNEWAIAKGYPEVINRLPSGRSPDVLRFDPDVQHLFLGDAKNADNETPRNSNTTRRIAGYVFEYGTLLGGKIRGGIFAIATNSEAEAQEWVLPLNLFCVMSQITDADGNRADFQIDKLEGKNTWIIWW
jgi:hypothetical protein